MLALRLLGAGCFFHKWEGNLSSEVSFRIALTDAGKKAARAGEALLRDYESSGDTRSRDPVDLARVFRRQAKPFPRHFWKAYSVDTPLGRWVPSPIANSIEETLTGEVEPYQKGIRRVTNPQRLDKIAEELRENVSEMRRLGWIKGDEDAVATWRARVEAFRDRDDLIRARVFNYERLPEVLAEADKQLVLHTFRAMRERLVLKRKRLDGLRYILVNAIENRANGFEDSLELLAEDAADALEKHRS